MTQDMSFNLLEAKVNRKPSIQFTYGKQNQHPKISTSMPQVQQHTTKNGFPTRDYDPKNEFTNSMSRPPQGLKVIGDQTPKLGPRTSPSKVFLSPETTLGKRQNPTDEVAMTYARLNVSKESDGRETSPSKKRHLVAAEKAFSWQTTTDSDVFDFPASHGKGTNPKNTLTRKPSKTNYALKKKDLMIKRIKTRADDIDADIFDFPVDNDRRKLHANGKGLTQQDSTGSPHLTLQKFDRIESVEEPRVYIPNLASMRLKKYHPKQQKQRTLLPSSSKTSSLDGEKDFSSNPLGQRKLLGINNYFDCVKISNTESSIADPSENSAHSKKKFHKEVPTFQNSNSVNISISDIGVSFDTNAINNKTGSVWEVVDAVSSSRDTSDSPRKQNLVAKMSFPSAMDKEQLFLTKSSKLGVSPTKSYTSSLPLLMDKIEDLDKNLFSTIQSENDFSLSPFDNILSNDQNISNNLSPETTMGEEYGFDDVEPSISSSPSFGATSNRMGVRVTYGKSRTIVAQDFDSYIMDSYSEPAGNEMGTELEPKRKGVKSIHELREQGENKRFTDEMEYLLDGLQDEQPLNVRRTSGLALCQKLLKPQFLMKIRFHNFVPRIYEILMLQQDPLLRCCYAFIICFMIEDKHNAPFLAGKADFVKLIVEFMSIQSDPLVENASGLWSKSEKSLISDIKNMISRSNLFLDNKQISLRSISLRSLSSIIACKTHYEDMIKKKLRIYGGLMKVTNILKLELAPVSKLLRSLENDKSPKVNMSLSLDFECIEHCLAILENVTAFCPENQLYIVNHQRDLLPSLLQFLLYSQFEACRENAEDPSMVMECLLACLRVLINLTNDNQACCLEVGCLGGMVILMRLATLDQLPSERSAHSDIKPPSKDNGETSENGEALKFDVLLLSIGLLTNLVEMESTNQDEFRKVEQYSRCPGTRRCLRKCTCPKRKSAVSCLVSLYNHQIEKGHDQTDCNIVAAYMAILMGLLIKDNEPNQKLILDILIFLFQSLINLLQDFVHFNELVDDQASTKDNKGGRMLAHSLSQNNSNSGTLGDTGDVEIEGGVQEHPRQRRTIADSFLEIVSLLKDLEKKRHDYSG
ncbi:hypothetical protein G9A89_002108 [Geosiphon pyriformis]|nr:hypothetical protein G9A89_002108 [Geosiphon pyriformis]